MRADVLASDWAWAVAHTRAHYPIEAFPDDGESLDCQTAKFARGLCDQITKLAQDRAEVYGDDQ